MTGDLLPSFWVDSPHRHLASEFPKNPGGLLVWTHFPCEQGFEENLRMKQTLGGQAWPFCPCHFLLGLRVLEFRLDDHWASSSPCSAPGHLEFCSEPHSKHCEITSHLCLPYVASFPGSPLYIACKMHGRHRPQPTCNLQGSWGGYKPRQQTIKVHNKAGVSISVFYVGAIEH